MQPSRSQPHASRTAGQNPVLGKPQRTRWAVIAAVVVAACAAAAFLAGPFRRSRPAVPATPVIHQPAWQWTLPDAPPGVTAEYGRLFEIARSAAGEVMGRFPDCENALAALALLEYLAHSPEGEMRCWQRCLELNPRHALAYQRLVSLYEESADFQRVVDLMHKALAADPGNVGFHNKLGSALMYLDRPQEARNVMEELLRTSPGTEDTYLVLGRACEQLQQLDKAQEFVEKAAAMAPARGDVLQSAATICAKRGDDEKAARYRAELDRIKKKHTQRESAMGVRHAMQDEANLPARVAEILRYAGRTYLDHSEPAPGEQCLLRAAEVCPQDPICRQMLANACDKQGRLEESLRWVQELRRLAPGDLEHIKNEGILNARLNRLDEAERIFRALCRAAPRSSLGYAQLAEFYAWKGRNLAEARPLAEKAVELEASARNWAVLAFACERTGDAAAARSAIQHAVRLDPVNPTLQQMYARIHR